MSARSRSPVRERPIRLNITSLMGAVHVYIRLSANVGFLKELISHALVEHAQTAWSWAAQRMPAAALTVTFAHYVPPGVLEITELAPDHAILRTFGLADGDFFRCTWWAARWGDLGPPAEIEDVDESSDESEDLSI